MIQRFRAFLEHPLFHPTISDRRVFKVKVEVEVEVEVEVHTSLYGKIDWEYR
jgi:hypothetical protein